jgi:Fe-S cluster biogenesis protein NfuA
MSAGKDEIRILAEPQMDPNVCSFHVDRPLSGEIVSCTSKDMAKGSPLLEAVFNIDGISQVMVTGFTVTVSKSGDDDWSTLGKKIGAAIRETIQSGQPLIAEDIRDRVPSNEALKKKVQAVIDEQINPGLASHGGGADLIDVQGTTVFLALSGGCQGCASAKYTLKHGIEQILREKAPEITGVVDVTDHAAGASPYY